LNDQLVGLIDTPDLAELVVQTMNNSTNIKQIVGTLTRTQEECTRLVEQKRELERAVERLQPRPVVIAVIRTIDGGYLITQRKPEQWMGGYWCFPGGKVEAGEDLKQTLLREVMEEVGVDVNDTGSDTPRLSVARARSVRVVLFQLRIKARSGTEGARLFQLGHSQARSIAQVQVAPD